LQLQLYIMTLFMRYKDRIMLNKVATTFYLYLFYLFIHLFFILWWKQASNFLHGR